MSSLVPLMLCEIAAHELVVNMGSTGYPRHMHQAGNNVTLFFMAVSNKCMGLFWRPFSEEDKNSAPRQATEIGAWFH